MKVLLQVINDGTTIPLSDGFPYEVGDVVTLKEEPDVAYKVVERNIITSKSYSASLISVNDDYEPPITAVILKVQRGKMVIQSV